MTWRYYAQRVRSNEWLDRDLQLQGAELTWTLTGPGQLTAIADGQTASTYASDGYLLLDEWRTFVYAENNDQIVWGGLVTDTADIGLGARSITCKSFSCYPHGRLWTGELSLYVTDAFNIIRLLWDFVQADANGDIGIQVSQNLANHVIGSADPGPRPEQNSGESNEDYQARLEAWQTLVNEPYELAWWNNPDCGTEIDNIMQQARADYIERHEWGLDKESVNHYIDLYAEGYTVENPGSRIGRGKRRHDLRFMEGENLKIPVLPERGGDDYANYVKGLGVGDGRFTLSYEAFGPDDGRLRRDKIYSAKNILVPDTLAAKTRDELVKAQNIVNFDQITVVDHPNAPIGSWELGDEILVQTHSGFEQLNMWMRVVEWSMTPDVPDTATLKLVNPDDL